MPCNIRKSLLHTLCHAFLQFISDLKKFYDIMINLFVVFRPVVLLRFKEAVIKKIIRIHMIFDMPQKIHMELFPERIKIIQNMKHPVHLLPDRPR